MPSRLCPALLLAALTLGGGNAVAGEMGESAFSRLDRDGDGYMVASDMAAMVMKNRAASAMGCRQNARMPSLTQARPVRAGTMWSFMDRF